MIIETKIKNLVHFDIDNRTNIKILNSIYIVFENQAFFKNGKPKGKPFETEKYYFFDNALHFNKFMKIHENYPFALSRIEMVVKDGLEYDEEFLVKNLNKI